MKDTPQSYKITKTIAALGRVNPHAALALRAVWKLNETHFIAANLTLGIYLVKNRIGTHANKAAEFTIPTEIRTGAEKKLFKEFDCMPVVAGEICVYRGSFLIQGAKGLYFNSWKERCPDCKPDPEIGIWLLKHVYEWLGCTIHFAYWFVEWLQHVVRTIKFRMRIAPVIVWSEGDPIRKLVGDFLMAVLGPSDAQKIQIISTVPANLVRCVLQKRLILLEDIMYSITVYQKLSSILSEPKRNYCDIEWMHECEGLVPGAILIFSSNVHSLQRTQCRENFSGVKVSKHKRGHTCKHDLEQVLQDDDFLLKIYSFLLNGKMVGHRNSNHTPCELQYAELAIGNIATFPDPDKASPKTILKFIFSFELVAFSDRDLALRDDCPISGTLLQKTNALKRIIKKFTDFESVEYTIKNAVGQKKVTVFHLLGKGYSRNRVLAEWRNGRTSERLYDKYKRTVEQYPEGK